MSQQEESQYLALMMDVYRRLREATNNRLFVRDICGKDTQEAQHTACEQLFLITHVHSFAEDNHDALTGYGGRYFEQAVDDVGLRNAVDALTDEERAAVAMKIAPRIIGLEKSPFGLLSLV